MTVPVNRVCADPCAVDQRCAVDTLGHRSLVTHNCSKYFFRVLEYILTIYIHALTMSRHDVSMFSEFHPPQWRIDEDKLALFHAMVYGDAAGISTEDQEGSGLALFHGGALDLYRGRGLPAEAHYEALRREIAPHMSGEGFKDWLKSSFKTVGKAALQQAGKAALSGVQAGFSNTEGSFSDKLKAGLKTAARDAGNAALKSSASSITQQFSSGGNTVRADRPGQSVQQPIQQTMQQTMSQPVAQPMQQMVTTTAPTVQKILASLA